MHAVELATVSDLPLLSESTRAADPQAVYARWRSRWGRVAPVLIEPEVPAWLVMDYDEACGIMRNERLWSRDPRNWRMHQEDALPPDAGILAFSPPEPRAGSYHHDGVERRRLRQALDDALEALPEPQVKASTLRVCLDAIERIGSSDRADLVADYASQVGFLATASMLGIEGPPAEQLMRDSEVISRHRPGAVEARSRIGATLMGHVRAVRQRPGWDLTSSMARHPNLHSDLEVVDSVAVPLHAASMFLGAWIARVLHVELADPGFRARWTGGRLGLDDVLDEVLWRDTPVPNSCAPRYAMQDVVLDDKLIRRGDAAVLALSAANNDPGLRTEDPWDQVGNRAHLAWGTGPHSCPAPGQARLITRTAVDALLQRLDLRLLVPANEVVWAPSPWVRQPQHLPVEVRRPVLHGTQVPDLGHAHHTWPPPARPLTVAAPPPTTTQLFELVVRGQENHP